MSLRKSVRLFLILSAALWMAAAAPGEAIWVDLDPQRVQEAIRWGKENLPERLKWAQDIEEWGVELAEGKGTAYLYTTFGWLALRSGEYAAIHMEIPPSEIEQILKATKGQLIFHVVLYGPDNSTLSRYSMRLEAGGKQVDPLGTDIFKVTPSRLEDPQRAFKIAYHVRFSLEGIDPQAPVALMAVGPEGQELRFPFDLSKMR